MTESDPPPWSGQLSLVERLQRELVTKLESVQRIIEAVRDQVSTLVLPSTATPKVREIFLKKIEEVKKLPDEIKATIGVLRKEKGVTSHMSGKC